MIYNSPRDFQKALEPHLDWVKKNLPSLTVFYQMTSDYFNPNACGCRKGKTNQQLILNHYKELPMLLSPEQWTLLVNQIGPIVLALDGNQFASYQ